VEYLRMNNIIPPWYPGPRSPRTGIVHPHIPAATV